MSRLRQQHVWVTKKEIPTMRPDFSAFDCMCQGPQCLSPSEPGTFVRFSKDKYSSRENLCQTAIGWGRCHNVNQTHKDTRVPFFRKILAVAFSRTQCCVTHLSVGSTLGHPRIRLPKVVQVISRILSRRLEQDQRDAIAITLSSKSPTCAIKTAVGPLHHIA